MEKASFLPKWELPFAKLTLLWPLWSWAAPHSGRTDTFIVWTGPSGRPILANGKHPLWQTLDVRFWHILSTKLLSFISKHRCDNSIISERLYINVYHLINTYSVLGQMVRRSYHLSDNGEIYSSFTVAFKFSSLLHSKNVVHIFSEGSSSLSISSSFGRKGSSKRLAGNGIDSSASTSRPISSTVRLCMAFACCISSPNAETSWLRSDMRELKSSPKASVSCAK